MNVAFFGSTSTIATSQIIHFAKNKKWNLYLFSRNKNKIKNNLKNIYNSKIPNNIFILLYSELEKKKTKYDLIINFIGTGNSNNINKKYLNLKKIFAFETQIINYLNSYNECKYIYFSSGIINFKNRNNLYYELKKKTEDYHNKFPNLHIYDLRIFNFFCKYENLDNDNLISNILNCIIQKKPFKTNKKNIYRDYLSSLDLFQLLSLIIKDKIKMKKIDAFSQSKISKFSLLRFFKNVYGLRILYNEKRYDSPTGSKDLYYPKKSLSLKQSGYMPKFDSISNIKSECKIILKKYL